jgi:hypothetical protein
MLLKNWFAGLSALRHQSRLRRPRRGGQWRLANLAAECLESRALLSNIAVTVQSGVITLTGDAGDHTVNAAVVAGELELSGAGVTTFTLNGNPATNVVDIPVTDPIKALHINLLQAGNNTLTFDGANLPTIAGNVVMQLGDGTDTVVFQNTTVNGIVDVHAGDGGDTIWVLNDALRGLAVVTGSGNDSILVSNVTLQGPGQGQTGSGSNADLVDGNAGKTGRPLVISTGLGDDTVAVDSVVSAGQALGSKWQIFLGDGNNTVTMDSCDDHGFLTITATGTENDVATVTNSSFGKQVAITLPDGQEQIVLSGDTFGGKVDLVTGTGSGSTISVDDSTFEKVATFTMKGGNATLNIETTTADGIGTEFQLPVTIALKGASGTVNLGTSLGDTLNFDKVVHITGGASPVTVNVVDANVTFQKKLQLSNATRVDF